MGNQPSNNVGNNNNNNNNQTTSQIQQLQQQVLNNQLEIQRIQMEAMRNNPSLHHNPMVNNPNLANEMSTRPELKAQFLRFVLSEFRSKMSAVQIQRINTMLQQLPQQSSQRSMPLMPKSSQNYNQADRTQVSTDQNNRVGVRTREYISEEERRKKEFELEQKKQREQFMEEQRRRKQEYQAKLTQLKTNNIDAVKLFGLNKKYTFDELKTAYKRVALRTHPDKGGSAEKFQLVTKCYFKLLEDLKRQESDKQYGELRQGASDYIKQQDEMSKQMKGTLSKDSFNLGKFNQVFEKNKLYDPNDEGYEDWFRNGADSAVEQPKIFSDKFNIDVFNNTFSDTASKSKVSTDIVERNEPTAMVSCSVGFTELGGANSGDFGEANRYCDLKAAYTNQSTFIDPSIKGRQNYNTIDDYQRSRDDISYEMTPEQMAAEEENKRLETITEEERLERLRRHDNITAQHYLQVHQSMLGYSKTPDMSRK